MKDHSIRPEASFTRVLAKAAEETKALLDAATGAVLPQYAKSLEHCAICKNSCQENKQPVARGFIRCSACASLLAQPRITREAALTLLAADSYTTLFQKEIYTPTLDRRRETMIPRLKELTDLIKTPKKVFEAGCGQGVFLDLLREAGFSSEGCDPLPYCVQVAKERGHDVVEGFFEDLSSLEQHYQAVIAWEVIAHSFDPALFFKRAYSILKPGGYFLLSTPNAIALEYDSIWSDGNLHHDNLQPHCFLQIFSPQGLTNALTSAGFQILQLTTPGTMDVMNISRLHARENLSYNSQFYNKLLSLDQTAELTPEAKAFQAFLAQYGYSGHMQVIAQK